MKSITTRNSSKKSMLRKAFAATIPYNTLCSTKP
jgi:hypothetical protein